MVSHPALKSSSLPNWTVSGDPLSEAELNRKKAEYCIIRCTTSLPAPLSELICLYFHNKRYFPVFERIEVYNLLSYNLLALDVFCIHLVFVAIPNSPQFIAPIDSHAKSISMFYCDKNFSDFFARLHIFKSMNRLHLHRSPLRHENHIPKLCEASVQVYLSGLTPPGVYEHIVYKIPAEFIHVNLFLFPCNQSCCIDETHESDYMANHKHKMKDGIRCELYI